ncbi:MAG: dethiobiotin synthase [Verrucomicrobium sp.]|nr:dethiobiotin synthase [Verrucomicrobium sp.]
MQLFVTGTGTGVGKTRFTTQWVRHWRARGVSAVGLKPISAGDRDDAKELQAAAQDALSLDAINPCVFDLPLSPWVASLQPKETGRIDYDAIGASIAAARARFSHVAVEGVGGWLVPLEKKRTVADWAKELGLPVVIVGHGGLGTLNHVLLTIESVGKSGLDVAGVVLNHHLSPEGDLAARTNGAALREWTGLPVVEIAAHGALPDRGAPWLAGE